MSNGPDNIQLVSQQTGIRHDRPEKGRNSKSNLDNTSEPIFFKILQNGCTHICTGGKTEWHGCLKTGH